MTDESVKYTVGMVVEHQMRTEWGSGTITEVSKTTVSVNFAQAGEKRFDINITPLTIICNDNGPTELDIGCKSSLSINRELLVKQQGEKKKPLIPPLSMEQIQKNLRETGHIYGYTYNQYGEPLFCTIKDDASQRVIVDHFSNPSKTYSLADLQKTPPPRSSGVYGWYFKELPPCVTKDGCTAIKTGWWPFRTNWYLLYIGKADNLRFRVYDMHFNNRYWMDKSISSLRLTLGCLLFQELGVYLQRHSDPQKDYTFGKKGDQKVSKWMAKYARVAWVETIKEEMAALEAKAIKHYVLPLNTKDKTNDTGNPYEFTPLRNLKKGFRDITKNQKIKNRDYKEVYKGFIKECKTKG